MKELSYLNKYFVKYKYSFSLGILFTIIAQIFMLFTPKLISQSFKVIEQFSKDKTVSSTVIREELISNVLLIVATTIVAGILTFLMRQTLIVMSRHIEFDLKNEVFRQYENLSQNKLKTSCVLEKTIFEKPHARNKSVKQTTKMYCNWKTNL